MIRKAEEKDALNLTALSLQVWLHTYATKGIRSKISQYVIENLTEASFLEKLKRPTIDIRLFEEDEHLIGFVVVDLESKFGESSESGFEIVTLYVSQHFQGVGVGRKLLKEVENLYGRPFWLSTWVENHSALGFYDRLGFKVVGEIKFDLEVELHSNHVLEYSGS